MALWECRGCTTAYSVGAPACPHCGSTDYREQGVEEMPKITVHGGATNAADGPQVVGAASAESNEPDQWPAKQDTEPTAEPHVSVSVDGVDQGEPEVGVLLGGPFEPLPEAVEGDTTEHVAVPDYEAWTPKELRDVLAERKLPTSGNKAALIARLVEADEEGSDG